MYCKIGEKGRKPKNILQRIQAIMINKKRNIICENYSTKAL